MATNPAGGSPYGDLSGTRQVIIKDSVKNQDATALTQAVANAATGDYTVGDLVDLINTAIGTASAVTSSSFGKASR